MFATKSFMTIISVTNINKQKNFFEPFLKYKEGRYLWNIDELSNVFFLDLVHVRSAPDKLFLFHSFFERTSFLELISASEPIMVNIWLHRCWWRILETKCAGDNYKILGDGLVISVTNCWPTSTIFLHWRRAPISTNRHQMKVTKITVTVRTTRFWFVLWSVAGFMITYFLSFFSDSFPFFNWFFSTINFFSLNKINNFNFIIFNFFI